MYKTFRNPKSVVPFYMMLNGVKFPMTHIEDLDEYSINTSDFEKLEIIAQGFCTLTIEEKLEFTQLMMLMLENLNKINKEVTNERVR